MTANTTRLLNTKITLFERVRGLAQGLVRKIEGGEAAHVVGSRLLTLGPSDSLRAIAALQTPDGADRLARAALTRSAYHAEQRSPGSAYLLLRELAGEVNQVEWLGRLSRRELESLAREVLGEGISKTFCEAIEDAGPLATMSIHRGGKSTYIKVTESLDIPVSPIGEFGENVDLRHVKFVSFDGVIEKVSEINRLLEESISTSTPVVIYARGWGQEVVSTLLYNWRRGNLRVLPVSAVSEDIQNFYFVDIPKVVNGLVDPGLSSLSIFDLPHIERVHLVGKTLSVFDTSVSSRSVEAVRRILEEKTIRDSLPWVMERARRLSSRRVEFFLGEDTGSMDGLYHDRLDYLVRFLLESRKSGAARLRIGKGDLVFPARSLEVSRESLESMRLETSTGTMVVFDG